MKDSQLHEEIGSLKGQIKQLEKELKEKDREILAFEQLSANMVSGVDVVPEKGKKKKLPLRAKKHKEGSQRTSFNLLPRSAMPKREPSKV